MIDPQAKPGRYIKLMALVILLGLVTALITFAFVTVVQQGTALIWEQAAAALGLDQRLFTLLVCTLGGLVVGLLVKFFGDHEAIFAEVMREFGRSGRFDYRNAPGIVVTAIVSLISGGSLGPEAPLADACGGLGTLTADRLKLEDKETRTLGYSGVERDARFDVDLAVRWSASGFGVGAGRIRGLADLFLDAVSRLAGLVRGHGGFRPADRNFLRNVVQVPGLFTPPG